MMGVDGLAKVDHESKRSEKRSRVLLTCRIRGARGETEFRLRDLSRKGALIEGDSPPPQGSELVFSRGATTVEARVAWVAGRRAGLEFLSPIEEAEVLAHVGKPAALRTMPTPPSHVLNVPQDRFKRPGVTTATMTAQERKLAEMWGVQVGINLSDH